MKQKNNAHKGKQLESMLTEIKVSQFQNLCSYNSKVVGFDELVRLVKYDSAVKNKTDAYRQMLKAVGKKEADEHVKKKVLPACSIAVLFNGAGRQVLNILGFTGLAFCDIDHVDDVEKAFEQVKADAHTVMAYKTVSGSGLRVIYWYTREQADAHIDSIPWRAAFIRGNTHFAQLTGQDYDGQCGDYSHLCGLAHDENVYVNKEAEPFVITDEEILQANFSSDNEAGKPRKDYDPDTFAESVVKAWPKVKSILAKKNLTFQSGHHHDYVMHASFLFNRFGADLDELLEWAAQEWSEYETRQREATIRSCYKKTAEHGTWKLRQQGRKKENAMITLPEIRVWLNDHYDLKYDEVTDVTTYLKKDGTTSEWLQINDRMVGTIRMEIAADTGKRILKSDLLDAINSNVATSFHPVREYLNALPKWDGVDRVKLLASYVTVIPTQAGQTQEEAQDFFEWAFHKWMVANVAMWMDDNNINQEMLILVGEQGIYKTTFFRSLLPPQLRNLYLENNHNTFSTKDDQISHGENCLVEVEEFNVTIPKEIGALKSSITAKSIKERRPYGRKREEKHRLAGFCGTCNEQNFLADDTGNRRFLCFLVSSIKSPDEWEIDYAQLYAQLRDEYQSGGLRYWFNHKEEQRIALQNEAFRMESNEEMLIRTVFREPRPGETGEWMNAAQIICHINNGHLGYGLSTRKVGVIMKRMGIKPVHRKNGNFYRVVKIPRQQQQAEIGQETASSSSAVQQPTEGDLPF